MSNNHPESLTERDLIEAIEVSADEAEALRDRLGLRRENGFAYISAQAIIGNPLISEISPQAVLVRGIAIGMKLVDMMGPSFFDDPEPTPHLKQVA